MDENLKTPANLDEPDATCESIISYKSVFLRARDAAREAGDLVTAEKHQWDLEGCSWSKQKTLEEGRPHEYGTTRFHPSHQIDDHPFPDMRQVTADQIDYWRARAAATSNPILKARYHDLIWEFEPIIDGRKRDYKMAVGAIHAYLDVAKLLKPGGRAAILWIDALERAAALAISVNQNTYLQTICALTMTEFATEPNPDGPFIHIWPLKLLIGIARHAPDAFSAQDLSAISDRIEVLINVARQWHHHDFEAECHELEFSLGALQGSGDVMKKHLAVGDASERQARMFFDAGTKGVAAGNTSAATAFLIAASHFETAQQKYGDAQSTEKVQEMKKMVRECYRLAQENHAYKTIQAPVEFTREEIEMIRGLIMEYAAHGTLAECLARIASDDQLLPDWRDAHRLVADEHRTPSLATLLRKTPIRDDRKIGDYASDESRIEYDIDQYLLQRIQFLYQLILGPAFHEIRRRDDCIPEGIVGFLDGAGLLKNDDAEIFRVGFAHYLKSEYIAAIHILVPRFESVLRNFLDRNGVDVTKYVDGRYEDRTLGAILQAGKDTLGEALYHGIRLILAGEEGMNLRNRVAHGQLAAHEASLASCDLVFHLILALAGHSRNTRVPRPE